MGSADAYEAAFVFPSYAVAITSAKLSLFNRLSPNYNVVYSAHSKTMSGIITALETTSEKQPMIAIK